MPNPSLPFEDRALHIAHALRYLLTEAERLGVVVQVELQNQQPLAQGNYMPAATLRERRGPPRGFKIEKRKFVDGRPVGCQPLFMPDVKEAP